MAPARRSKTATEEVLSGATERVLKQITDLYEVGLSGGAPGAMGLKQIAEHPLVGLKNFRKPRKKVSVMIVGNHRCVGAGVGGAACSIGGCGVVREEHGVGLFGVELGRSIWWAWSWRVGSWLGLPNQHADMVHLHGGAGRQDRRGKGIEGTTSGGCCGGSRIVCMVCFFVMGVGTW